MWSIVAIRAFRHPCLCDWSTINGFPRHQKPSLEDTVLINLVDAQSTTRSVDIPWCGDMTALVEEQQEWLIDWMYDVVKSLAWLD